MSIVREAFSPSKNYKVEITKRNDGKFEINVYFWDDEWETWISKTSMLSLTDSEERALLIAIEELRNISGENIEPI